MISFYAYELDLFEDMKIHFMFHINLLLFLKHDSVRQQMSKSLFVIVENEENSYFVDLIDDMRWWIQEAQFELLIKWKKYEWKTWKLYMIIKKHFNFDKKISWKLFFTICFSWMNKKKLIIAFLIYNSWNESQIHNSWKQKKHETLLFMNNIWIWTWTWFWSWSKIISWNMIQIWRFWNF